MLPNAIEMALKIAREQNILNHKGGHYFRENVVKSLVKQTFCFCKILTMLPDLSDSYIWILSFRFFFKIIHAYKTKKKKKTTTLRV